MSAVEKLLILSFYELRLLARSRGKLAAVLCLPFLGGFFFGLAGRWAAESSASYGLFLILPISSLLLASIGFRIDDLLSVLSAGVVNPIIGHASRTLAVLLILAVQAALYVGLVSLLDLGSVPRIGMLVAALVLSLVVGLVIGRFSRPRQ